MSQSQALDLVLDPQPARVGLSLGAELRILGGFLRRNLAVFVSNRTNTCFNLIGIFVAVLTYGCMGMFVGGFASASMKGHLQGCEDYTSFLIIGYMVQLLIWSANGNMTFLIRSREFPNLYMAPCRLPTLIIGANVWKYTWLVLQAVFFIVLSNLMFGIHFHMNLGFVAVILCGVLLMTAFDMIGAGFKVITKSDNDPLHWAFSITGTVLSGSLIPVSTLPPWAQTICHLHPQYYVNTLARRTMGEGLGLLDVWPDLQNFLICSVILLVLGYWIFLAGFRRARIEGTLGHA